MLTALGNRVARWVEDGEPWTNVYGVGRSLIALSSALTLACNHSTTLWRPIAGVAASPPFCNSSVQNGALFCLAPSHLEVTRWIAVAILLLAASGWRPRITGAFHWWVAISYQLTASTMEGGDQAAAVLSLLFLPVALTDPRRWHWAPPPPRARRTEGLRFSETMSRLVALSALVVIRLQVAGIYYHAATGKLKVTEWADGTAMYYWLSNPVFGAPHALQVILRPVLQSPSLLAGITWGSIVIELFLCAGLLATRRVRAALLCAGVALHVGILVFMGLFTFSVTMFGALVLYLRPTDAPFVLPLHGGSIDARARTWLAKIKKMVPAAPEWARFARMR